MKRTTGSSVDYGYDAIGRLTSLTDAFTGGTGSVSQTFTYNPANQIRTRTRSNDDYASNTAYLLTVDDRRAAAAWRPGGRAK